MIAREGGPGEEEFTMVAKSPVWRPRLATWRAEVSIRETRNPLL